MFLWGIRILFMWELSEIAIDNQGWQKTRRSQYRQPLTCPSRNILIGTKQSQRAYLQPVGQERRPGVGGWSLFIIPIAAADPAF